MKTSIRLLLLVTLLGMPLTRGYGQPVLSEQQLRLFEQFKGKQNQCRQAEARQIAEIFLEALQKKREIDLTYERVEKLLGPPSQIFHEGYGWRYDINSDCQNLASVEENLGLLVMGLPNPSVVVVGKHDPTRESPLPEVLKHAKALVDRLIMEGNSKSGLLNTLAVERYRSDTRKGEKRIFSVHEGKEMGKFFDGRYSLVSLPYSNYEDKIALCNYVTHYNSQVEMAADLKVKAKDFAEAKVVYELLAHFDKCGMRDRYSKKLNYVRILETKEDPEVRKKFMELCDDLFVQLDLTTIDGIEAEPVRNLLGLSW